MRLTNCLSGSVTGVVLILGMSLRVATPLVLLGASFSCAGVELGAAERSEPRRTYNLPRGEAASTLRQFATASNRQVFFMMGKVQGEQTNAVAGDFTPAEALDLMLAGTGLVVLQNDGHEEFVVSRRSPPAATKEVGHDNKTQPQPKSEPMKPTKPLGKLRALLAHLALAATTVANAQQDPQAAPANERADVIVLTPFTVSASANTGYGAQMGTTSRLATPYIDTPQAASIVTSELLADANLTSSLDALQYVPSAKGAGFTGRQSLRGLDTGNLYSDGMLNRSALLSDTFFADRIEVVKGPSSTSFGRGDPAGFINYISKRPRFRDGTDIGVMVGTGNDKNSTYRFTFDNDGFLSKDHKTAYRFVALHADGAQTLALSHYIRDGMQLAITKFFQNGNGRFDVIAALTKNKDPYVFHAAEFTNEERKKVAKAYNFAISGVTYPDYNVLGDDHAPALDGSVADRNMSRVTALLDYKLNDHWRTRQAANFYRYTEDGLFSQRSGNIYARSDGTLMLNGILFARYNRTRQLSYQSDFLGQYHFDTLGANLNILGGADINSFDVVDASSRTSTAVVPQPFYNWNRSIYMGPLLKNPASLAGASTGQNTSAYGQGQLTLFQDRVRLSAAVRRIWQDVDSFNRATLGTSKTKTHTPVLPTYSLLFKPTSWLSLYATTSKHIEPASVLAKFQSLPPIIPSDDPRRSQTINIQPQTQLFEVGAKANLFNERLTCSVTYYEAKAGGAASNFLRSATGSDGSPIVYVELINQDDRVKGWEFEGFGQVTNHLSFLVGGNLGTSSSSKIPYNGKIVDGLVYNVGDSVYGYATYNFGVNRYDGLSITGGWKTLFSGWAIRLSDPLKQTDPETQNLVDLRLAYGFKKKYQVYLGATNILHSESLNSGDANRISGRLVSGGMNARF